MSKSLHLQSASDSFLQRIMQVRHIPTYYIIISTYRTRKVYPVFLLSSFFPVHLLLSSRVNLSSVMFQETVDRIRERVLPMWPDGVEFQVYRDETSEYLVKFSGNPWTARSSLGVMAMKLILELFAVLARQGYTCASSIDTGGAVCETCYMQRLGVINLLTNCIGYFTSISIQSVDSRPICGIFNGDLSKWEIQSQIDQFSSYDLRVVNSSYPRCFSTKDALCSLGRK